MEARPSSFKLSLHGLNFLLLEDDLLGASGNDKKVTCGRFLQFEGPVAFSLSPSVEDDLLGASGNDKKVTCGRFQHFEGPEGDVFLAGFGQDRPPYNQLPPPPPRA